MGSSVDRRAVGLFLGLAGIVAITIGVFLPLWDEGSVVFSSITGNSLLQSGDGIWGLAIAGIGLFALFRAWQGGKGGLWMLITGIAVTAYAVWLSQADTQMTLCPATATSLDDQACQVADPGLGLYAVGAGGVALAVAGLIMLGGKLGPVRVLADETEQATTPLDMKRECEHCKSIIRPDATVCAVCRRDVNPWSLHEGTWWERQPDGSVLRLDPRTLEWETPVTGSAVAID